MDMKVIIKKSFPLIERWSMYFVTLLFFFATTLVFNAMATPPVFSETPNISFPETDGAIRAIVVTSDNSTIYIGGDFTTVGGLARNRIAKISSDGIVDPDFNPSANNTVNSLVLSSDESIIYTGGSFSNIGGQTRGRIAALNTTDGTTTSWWNPNANGEVYSLALNNIDNSIIYTGGYFTTIAGMIRNYIVALDTDLQITYIYTMHDNGFPVNFGDSSVDLDAIFIDSVSTPLDPTPRTSYAEIAAGIQELDPLENDFTTTSNEIDGTVSVISSTETFSTLSWVWWGGWI